MSETDRQIKERVNKFEKGRSFKFGDYDHVLILWIQVLFPNFTSYFLQLCMHNSSKDCWVLAE